MLKKINLIKPEKILVTDEFAAGTVEVEYLHEDKIKCSILLHYFKTIEKPICKPTLLTYSRTVDKRFKDSHNKIGGRSYNASAIALDPFTNGIKKEYEELNDVQQWISTTQGIMKSIYQYMLICDKMKIIESKEEPNIKIFFYKNNNIKNIFKFNIKNDEIFEKETEVNLNWCTNNIPFNPKEISFKWVIIQKFEKNEISKLHGIYLRNAASQDIVVALIK